MSLDRKTSPKPRRRNRFLRNERAVAAVEFALIMPFMLLLYLGAVDATNAYIANQRINSVSVTLGDLVSRSNGRIGKTTLTDYFMAAETIMVPFKTSGLIQVVSELSVDESGHVKVVWTQSYPPNKSPYAPGQDYPQAKINTAKGILGLAKGHGTVLGHVIVSETTYGYKPLTEYLYKSTIPMSRENYYLPRFGEAITYEPAL